MNLPILNLIGNAYILDQLKALKHLYGIARVITEFDKIKGPMISTSPCGMSLAPLTL